MKKNPPEKYAVAKDVPMKIETGPGFPSLGSMLPEPGRTKIKGTGAATKGLTFGKNG